MKKYLIILSSALVFFTSNSCSNRDLELLPPDQDSLNEINTPTKLQQLLNGAYLSISSANALGAEATMFADILGDKFFVSNSNSSYTTTYTYNYSATVNDFKFYGTLYDMITKCNFVIQSSVPEDEEVIRMKAEAKILRGMAYFILVNYYSPTPSSGVNQEYGVPLVTDVYDVTIQPARATVAEVYDRIIQDLTEGAQNAEATPQSKVLLGKDAAKLLLSRVYITRRAAGDAQKAVDLATQVIDSAPAGSFGLGTNSISAYTSYFAGNDDTASEEQPETIWELDFNQVTNRANGIGSNVSLPVFYSRQDSRRSMLINQSFYSSFAATDIRRGSLTTGLISNTGPTTPNTDSPKGYWMNKYPRLTSEGNYVRDVKILRYSEAYLNRIEGLYLAGQNAQALTELNAFAASRNGSLYTGADLLNDILTERAKELYGEGHRFFDLKRHNLPVVRPSNCTINCTIPAGDKLFVFPIPQGALNSNANLKQYPGYN
ncbi:RagB/SusD family nutrient uptake outer membrane protein [Kaistella rhinocerotis]|uniref:RagB/SusD family nutrient uptake outer membrane protein n=1 Tax=Kaistella rhinocerotis TaxID=3026437 RepID=UPI0025549B75|nr:RagB/SusD family nutrient uptake outer membrane protein [Kaistella sp. Ran72]